jgi:cytochrome c oxidase subunit I
VTVERQPLTRDSLALAHLYVAITALLAGAALAIMQALSRANLALPLRTARIYYLSVTAHGVLMGLVFTTFFIMGLGYVFARVALGRVALPRIAWASFWLALAGTLAAAATILAGKSTVLYTFYPPLQAHPLFYIGATALVVGSWGWCVAMIASYRAFRKGNPGVPVPLAMHGILTTVAVWLLATAGLACEVLGQLIPWSLGWVATIDPLLARTYFWWFGHPLVYFWLLPAYTVWYAVLPKIAGGKLFSDRLARMVFILFVLFSTPVGFHHQFMDPGISSSWKFAHMVATFVILYPSLVTAFTIIASLELAARARGGRGLFAWVRVLPWGDPLFASVALAMLTFALGGFGGAINAAYAMNAMVHNTAWIPGHFHLTVGTATALTFMGTTYWLLPRLTGKELRLAGAAQVQPYLWFVGMLLFGVVNHITGILGMPRRIYDAAYGGSPIAARWAEWTTISAVGGVILFLSAMLFGMVVIATLLGKASTTAPPLEFAEAHDVALDAPGQRGIWDRWALWVPLAILLVAAAYAYPILHHLGMERFGSVGFKPF